MRKAGIFPPPNGTDHPLVTGSLKLCGVTIMLPLLLTQIGLVRSRAAKAEGN
ncbi:MAG TPA: hypothetical protein VGH65_00275 [Verrucomicrobiaceae bacterium]